ncbi:PPOX class F420-dependent oxidoreductase [Asanoa ishikariensis]|uniref:PPOX class probable F420-dependent enzyme, Rv0121 family n=1 Tax=Asanoa ishikariensis TaxID=137265 RepID=A0A1H3TW87_9ACTN|nr:TIGR03668 family PPOX class F420-dependent oxidoreductase [Asanoa ishikariensis]GIF67597.1 PPOX class F420-dependent oxidoreductase [Asanoa ishikariensis]SDZ54490.1 PPOX class probable F420-dependent enzyme, Rv0121 family [Asanoa ishikariensis]
MTPDDARARFAEARVARLATVSGTGQPHLVPITFALEGDTVYSAVDAKPKRSPALRRLANVEANPQASMLVDFYDDDWSRLWWARADGTARILTSGPEADRAATLLGERYPAFARRGPVLAVDVHRWSGWSAA